MPSIIPTRTMAKFKPKPSEVGKAIKGASDQVNPALWALAQRLAPVVQGIIQEQVRMTYRKGTGRWASGIRAKAVREGTGATIRVTMINYREANFLTMLSANPHWANPWGFGGATGYASRGIPPYTIFARGVTGPSPGGPEAEEADDWSDWKKLVKRGYRMARARLKVPKAGMIAVQNYRGGLSRVAREPEFNQIGGEAWQRSAYFYPLWVHHPGIPRDVIADGIAIAGGILKDQYYNEARVIFESVEEGIHLVPTSLKISRVESLRKVPPISVSSFEYETSGGSSGLIYNPGEPHEYRGR